jgi:hypothetical protein
MFRACCEDTVVRSEDFYVYKGDRNAIDRRVPIRESQINPMLTHTPEQVRLYAAAKEDEEVRKFKEKKELFVDKEFPPN